MPYLSPHHMFLITQFWPNRGTCNLFIYFAKFGIHLVGGVGVGDRTDLSFSFSSSPSSTSNDNSTTSSSSISRSFASLSSPSSNSATSAANSCDGQVTFCLNDLNDTATAVGGRDVERSGGSSIFPSNLSPVHLATATGCDPDGSERPQAPISAPSATATGTPSFPP